MSQMVTHDSHDLEYWFAQAEAAAGFIRLIVLTPIFPDGLKVYQNPEERDRSKLILDYEGTVATGAGVLLAGRELGMDPTVALRSITFVKGTVTLYAMAMRGLLIQQGHELVIRESTDNRAVISARRKGSENWQQFTWDLDRAKKAALYPGDQRGNWFRQTKAMLLARASSEAARYVAPDALMGMPAIYEELADADREAPKAIEGAMAGAQDGQPPAETKAVAQRRRKPAQTALPSGPPAPDRPQPAQPPEPVYPKINTAQRNRMFGLLRQLGKGDQKDRAEALTMLGGMLQPPRELDNTGELLAPEADAIIANLEGLVALASKDQSEQGEPGHAPKDSDAAPAQESASSEVAEGEVAPDDQPKSGEDWPPDSAGASANE